MTTNIGRSNDDASYRYKMPKLIAKVESSGNGIKTVITNLVDVSRALRVPPIYPTKFYSVELGAQANFDAQSERCIITGNHKLPDLEKILNKFIEQFVLCPTCKYPEIIFEVLPRKEIVKIDCAACGHHSVLDMTHKLSTFILKNPPSTSKGSAKSQVSKKDKKDKKKSGKESDEEDNQQSAGQIRHLAEDKTRQAVDVGSFSQSEVKEQEVEWFTDTSDEAALARKEEEMRKMGIDAGKDQTNDLADKIEAIMLSAPKDASGKESPAVVLGKFISSGDRKADEVVAELKRIMLARDLDDTHKLPILFEALFNLEESIVPQVKKSCKILRKACKDEVTRRNLLYAFEDLLGQKEPKFVSKTPIILQSLYENGVIPEEEMLAWFTSPVEASVGIKKEAVVAVRKKAHPFIEWLRSAESDSEEEED